MALIYRQNALYMQPNRQSVDVTDGVTFSFIFKGYQMQKAIGQLYTNTNIGEWSPLGDPFEFAPASGAPYYNNQTITYQTSSGTVYNNISANAGSILGWGVEVLGMPSTQTAAANNKMTPAIKGFETGNKVYTYTGSSTSNPYNYSFISNYDSKLTLGTVNTGADVEGTDLTNTFTVTQGVYINLTTGSVVQVGYGTTPYYLYKVNEGASDPVGYYVRFYDTEAHALAGGTDGVISGATLENQTYYVNPVTSTTNIFYVGVLGGNSIQLYTTKEASLQGVAEAIVPLTSGSAYTIQMGESSQVVQWTPIMANSLVFDLATMYDGQVVTLQTTTSDTIYTYNYSGELYTGQMLSTMVDGERVNYYIHVWSPSTLSLYTDRESAIINDQSSVVQLASGHGTIYLAEILSDKHVFTLTWADANNIPMITQWEANLYNVSVDEDLNVLTETLIEQSGVQYTGEVEYTFQHLLLSCLSNLSGTYNDTLGRYKVSFDLTDNNGYEYTGSVVFDVGYGVASTNYSPLVKVNNCDSSVTVNWSNALSSTGTTTGTVNTINNVLYSGNTGAQIAANSTLHFDTLIPSGTLPTFLFIPASNNFSGVIATMDGESQTATISYDRTNHEFILSIKMKNWNDAMVTTVIDTDVTTLSSSKAYLIGYAEGKVYIREYENV